MKNNLSARRKELHLTQLQIAQVIHIHENAYQRYERGLVEPSVSMAIKIAQALNSTVEELFVLDDDQNG